MAKVKTSGDWRSLRRGLPSADGSSDGEEEQEECIIQIQKEIIHILTIPFVVKKLGSPNTLVKSNSVA